MDTIGLEIDVQTARAAQNIGELRKAFDDAKNKAVEIGKAFGENSDEFQKAQASLSEMVTQFKNYGAGIGALRESKQILEGLTAAYGANSKEAIAAAKATAQIKFEMEEAQKFAQAFDPSKRFEVFGQAVRSAAGGFTALTGGMALLGGQSEETSKKILQVQAALALTEGLNSIKEVGLSFSRLAIVVKTTVVEAFSTLRSAIISTGIGALVIGIGYLISKFIESAEAAEKATKAQRELNEAMLKADASVAGQISQLEALVKVARDTTLSTDERLQAIQKLNHDYPQYLGNINLETIGTDKVTDAIHRQITALKTASEAKAISSLLDQKTLERIQLEDKLDKVRETSGRGLGGSLLGAAKEKTINELIQVGDAIDVYTKKLTSLTEKQAAAGDLFNSDEGGKLGGKAGNIKEPKTKSVKEDPAIKRAQELNQELLNENEKANHSELEQDLIAARQKFDKRVEILRAGGLSIIEAQKAFEEERKQIFDKYAEEERKTYEENENKKLDAEKKADAERKREFDKTSKERAQSLTDNILHELKLGGLSFEQKKNFLDKEREYVTNSTEFTAEDRYRILKALQAAEDDIDNQKLQHKYDVMNAEAALLTAASDFLGQQTAAGKTFAIAATLISTYAAAQKAYESQFAALNPTSPILANLAAAAAVIQGLARVKAIANIQVPGKTSTSFAGGSFAQPNLPSGGQLNPALQNNTTILDKKSIDDLANQALRAFVVESDISGSQGRILRIKRSAIFG